MADTPNMSIPLDTPGVTPGTRWAEDNEEFKEVVDDHDHTDGKGNPVPTAGMLVNDDLTFDGWAATELRMARFENQAAEPTAGDDVRGLYVYGENLYFINSSGTKVKITNAGVLNASALNANTYVQSAISVNETIGAGDTYTQLLVDSSVGALVMTLDPASGFSSGRVFKITDVGNGANTITITPDSGASNTINGITGSRTFRLKYGTVDLVRISATGWSMEQHLSHVINSSTEAVGHVLQITATGEAKWAALNLTPNDANYRTGRLPAANMFQATDLVEGIVQLTEDFGGTSTAPTVVGLTGASGVVDISARFLEFDTAGSVAIRRAVNASDAGEDFYIEGQDAAGSNKAGGLVGIVGGEPTGTGKGGDVYMAASHTGQHTMFSGQAFSATRRVAAILGYPSTTDVPVGDKVVYLANVATAPSTNPSDDEPVGGLLMYASSGRLALKQSDGMTLRIGDAFATSGSLSTSAGVSVPAGSCTGYLQVSINGTSYKIPLYT